MENKELIKNETYNECGNITPLHDSVISFLQILIPKPTTSEAKDDEPLSYKNCNSFELLYDNRRPQILYYLGDYMYDAEANPSRFLSCLPNINFEGTTVGDGGDLVEMYKACEAIKQWAENTMYLIGEKCIEEINDKINEEVDEYCEESRKRLLDKLYELGKEQYEKEKDQTTSMSNNDENHTSDWDKANADILKDMEKLGWNINNKTQDNEI